MEGIYDESYILNSQDSDFSIYERKFENLTSETVFTHMHFHRDFEILYVTNGCAQMQVADKKIVATPESVVLINAHAKEEWASIRSWVVFTDMPARNEVMAVIATV